jgi:hypothetical protein
MKEYSFVSLNIDRFFGSKSQEHREIIEEKAREGYRYAGFVPTDISDYGKIRSMDLIFERDKDAE